MSDTPAKAAATKPAIRAWMRNQRAKMDAAARQSASQAITTALLARPEFQRANEVACFISLPQELDTSVLLDACHRQSKRVSVPAWDAASKIYTLVHLLPNAAIVDGPHGVPEPAERRPVDLRQIELAIIPGLAFDAHGGRLGYGGGYYDRMLAGCSPTCVKAAIAYAFQVWPENLPLKDHDVRVNLIITERGVLTTHA